MKNIVILGGSPAGVKAIEEIRSADSSCSITLIAFDGHYPCKRDAFAPFIAKEISPENVFYRSKDFYEQHNVNVILDKKISRINVKRKRIFTEDKGQIDYDVLIITDTPENRFPDIKGTNKSGIFGYKKLNDIDLIVNDLLLAEVAVVQSDSFSGLQAAAAFVKRGKETFLISSEKDFLGRHFEPEVLQWLVGQFEEMGLRIMRGNKIAEILGDKKAKAIRLDSGKVFAVDIIIFGETDEDLRIFSNSGLQMDQKINVNTKFQASIESIFVVDQTCSASDTEPVIPLNVLEEQGRVVAAAVRGEEVDTCTTICSWNMNMEKLAITVLGKTEKGEGTIIRQTFDQESGVYKGLYIEDQCLVGAVLVNAEHEKDEILRLITTKSSVEAENEEPAANMPSKPQGDRLGAATEGASAELVDS